MEENKQEGEQENPENTQQADLAPPVEQDVDNGSKEAQKDEIEDKEEALASGDEIQVVEEDVEGGEDDDASRPKKKRRRIVKRIKRRKSFDLCGVHHVEQKKYNALKDSHLQSYFVNDRVRKHLQKQNLITKEGYIIEKPDEYRRNKMLLKAHFRSSSPNRDGNPRKTKKVNKENHEEVVDKENHENFIEDIKNQYKLEE